jgi:cytochrome b involved in lipid metabolism
MRGVAGKDATKKFNKYHNPKILERYKTDLKVGELSGEKQAQDQAKESSEQKSAKADGNPKFSFLKWKS